MTRIEEFHAQITSLEDELNEARTETSRIKTEYINEKASKEIKLAELQTKINEVCQFNQNYWKLLINDDFYNWI